ncbi:glycosyltransferase family 2 protein [Arenicella xantha]|uniref:Glycosyltransferase involved in cell wall biosynthesis n=1 Tax=Arenicella xantha TaxID=644221 RepID=A0A395JK47_9GAMM|nr:glycosyltransferase family 2 protein [Arenicella xantha]RBP49168.1 glycosyltransferase involved in cell wall biosynthesis [Arenicella xantha]
MAIEKETHVMVSVIIPAYNCDATLTRAVESVFEDACKDIEIIIVNDGSIDNTALLMTELQNRYQPLIKISHQANFGGNSARNLGLDLASGKYIQFLDADDFLMNDKLAISVDAFQTDERLSCVYTDGCLNGDSNLKLEAAHSNLSAIVNNQFDEFTFGLNTNMPMFKRTFLSESGERWDEDLGCWQESEYFFRLMLSMESNDNVLHLPQVGFSRILTPHGIGQTQNTTRYVEHKIKAIFKIYQLCIDKGLDNLALENQVNGFLWVLYKQCVLQKLDMLIPTISDRHQKKSLLQMSIYRTPPRVIRVVYRLLSPIKRLFASR